jgi:tRNA(fMet)-specific endonuclease VapC
MRLCLDTSAYAAFKRGDRAVTDRLEAAEEILVPAIVLGELFAGFHQGTRARQNTTELQSFLAAPGVTVAPVDTAVAERYGLIVKHLRQQGTPIPANDLWIAAIAMDSGSRLLARDQHFDRVPGLFVVAL